MSTLKKQKQSSLLKRTIITLCLIILPFNILSIVISLFLMNNVRNTFRQSIDVSLDSYTTIIEQRMDNIDYLLYTYPNSNTNFYKLLLNLDNWHYNLYLYNITSSLEEAMNLSDSADGMIIFVPEKDDMLFVKDNKFFQGKQIPHLSETCVTNYIYDPSFISGKWTLITENDTQFMLRIVQNKNYYFGAYINCTNALNSLKATLDNWDSQVYLSTKPTQTESGYLVCQSPLGNGNIILYCLIHNSYVTKSISAWLYMAIAFLVLSLSIIPMVVFLYHRKINHPLGILLKAFHKLEHGEEGYRITEQARHSEFADAFQSFNVMAQTTSELKQKALDEERAQHALAVHNLNLKLDNLQLQIRPHFLSNTMNLLFTLVHNHQEENAKRLILYISQYFRYMFRSGKEQELFDKELKLVEEYLYISEMHYSNAFTVSYQIDPILSLMRFLPLLLHNFVENIIQHALIPGQTVNIVIYGEYDENEQLVTLHISDDGRGMSEEFVAMVNNNDFSSVPKGKHIGIRNSINRLNYYYQGGASVTVESEAGVGTTFTIQIKYNLTMDEA